MTIISIMIMIVLVIMVYVCNDKDNRNNVFHSINNNINDNNANN